MTFVFTYFSLRFAKLPFEIPSPSENPVRVEPRVPRCLPGEPERGLGLSRVRVGGEGAVGEDREKGGRRGGKGSAQRRREGVMNLWLLNEHFHCATLRFPHKKSLIKIRSIPFSDSFLWHLMCI